MIRYMKSLPVPAPWTDPLPTATPPADMAIHQLPTGTYETRAAFAVRGGSFRDKRQFASTAILIEHPSGDFLIDAGFGADVAKHVAMLPRFIRAPYETTRTVSEQLNTSGYDRSKLRGVILTHSHWDHSSGLDSLEVPVWMNQHEIDYAASDGDGKVFRSVSQGHDIHPYVFDGPPTSGSGRVPTSTETERWLSPKQEGTHQDPSWRSSPSPQASGTRSSAT